MDEYTGFIVRTIWKNPENKDFAIALFRTTPTDQRPQEEFKVKGPLKRYLDRNAEVSMTGQWENTAKFGPTFVASTVVRKVPKDKTAIRKHLGAVVDKVGQKTLDKIVNFFGEETIEVIRKEPARLTGITGVSKATADKIVRGVRRDVDLRDLELTINGYQVPVGTAQKLMEKLGPDAKEQVINNPYVMIGIEGVRFKSADRMARNIAGEGTDFNEGSVQRAEGKIKDFVEEQTKNGHACVPTPVLMVAACEDPGISPEVAETALQNLINAKVLIFHEAETQSGKVAVVYLPAQYYAEVGITKNVNRIIYAPFEKPAPQEAVLHVLTELESLAQKKLNDEQKAGVERAFTYKISVITGKPGTGKTTATRAIVAIAEALGLKFGLCAPTGRAAKNMTNACGRKAVTIHRLLEFNTARKEGDSIFKKHEDNQLGYDIILVDEASMVDAQLLRYLLEAIPNGCRVVFIGDDNQLPSVGAGRCLHDLINSGIFPVTQLHVIHRQAQESHIVLNAHRILNGERLEFPINSARHIQYSDCAFLETPMIKNPDTEKEIEDPKWVQDTIRELCANLLPTNCFLDPVKDVQVLTPRKDGPCGVNELNRILQHTINPNGKVVYSWRDKQFREGDRVMVIHNNYELDVFNGDVGIVKGYDINERSLLCDFYGEDKLIPETKLDSLVLAYAATVHKSQGSEYKAVIMLVLKQHGIMLQRNLLYTGITRAKQRLVVVGSKKALTISIRNVKPVQRHTLLWNRLARLRVSNVQLAS